MPLLARKYKNPFKKENMKVNKHIAAIIAVLGLALVSVAAIAEDHPFTEGAVVNVSAIRTEYGRFDDYLKFLDRRDCHWCSFESLRISKTLAIILFAPR
jgi:uncharacterized membrane protein